MARPERVMRALGPARVARDAVQLAQRVELVEASREQLVRVALVPHVPDDLVLRRIEHAVERQREFDHAEVRRQVAGIAGHGLDDDVAHLGRELLHLGGLEPLHVGRGLDLLEHAHSGWWILYQRRA